MQIVRETMLMMTGINGALKARWEWNGQEGDVAHDEKAVAKEGGGYGHSVIGQGQATADLKLRVAGVE